MSLSGKYNFPVTTEAQGDDVPAGSIKPALKAWQAQVNEARTGDDRLDYKSAGWTSATLADFIVHCCGAQGVTGGDDLIAAVEAAMTETGQTPRAVGAQAVREVLKAWNQSQETADAAGVAVGGAAAGAASLDPLIENTEIARYAVLHNNYMKLPFNMNKVKRTGWTRLPAGYTPVMLNSDKHDWGVIVACFIALYAGLCLFFWAMLEASLATDDHEDRGVLWTFVILFFVAWGVLGVAVSAGNSARARAEAEAAANAGTV